MANALADWRQWSIDLLAAVQHTMAKIITRSCCAICEIRITFADFNIAGDSIVLSPLGPDGSSFGNVSLWRIADEKNKNKYTAITVEHIDIKHLRLKWSIWNAMVAIGGHVSGEYVKLHAGFTGKSGKPH